MADFGFAIHALRLGQRVARDGWNGRGMYLALQVPDSGSKMTLPYIYMKTVQDDLVPWLASQTDLLGEDWGVLDVSVAPPNTRLLDALLRPSPVSERSGEATPAQETTFKPFSREGTPEERAEYVARFAPPPGLQSHYAGTPVPEAIQSLQGPGNPQGAQEDPSRIGPGILIPMIQVQGPIGPGNDGKVFEPDLSGSDAVIVEQLMRAFKAECPNPTEEQNVGFQGSLPVRVLEVKNSLRNMIAGAVQAARLNPEAKEIKAQVRI